MPKFIRGPQKSIADVGAQVAAGLERGPAVVPLLGGCCVLSLDRDGLAGHEPGRLVAIRELEAELAGLEPSVREVVREVMSGPVVGRFGAGRPSIALAAEPLAQEIVIRARGEVWLGVSEEAISSEALADEIGKSVSVVVSGGAGGPGPTIVDFSRRPAVVDRRGKLAILDLERELRETVRMGPGLYFSVLVVCTGNSCRSPMARVMLAQMLEGLPVLVSSAGTGAPQGSTATAQAIEVMREAGLDLTRHRAQQLSPGMITGADLVLVMDDYHRQRVLELVPDAASRTKLLLSFVGREEKVDDPMGFPLAVYRMTRERMKPALEKVAAEVRQRAVRS